MIYILILIVLTNYPDLQLMLCVILSLLALGYQIYALPFGSRLRNFVVIFNETLTGMCFAVSLVFNTDISEDESATYGMVIVVLAGAVVFFNIGIVLIQTLVTLI